MKSNKTIKKLNNPFSLTFGIKPVSFVETKKEITQIINDFNSDFPLSYNYFITGLRGSGKTVLLTSISKELSKNDNWIIVDINPERSILEQIAGGILSNAFVKKHFIKKEFSFSFHGFGLSLEGDIPISDIVSLVKKMLEILKKHNKKLLICIDEVSNKGNIRSFVLDYQIFLRNEYKIYLLMTGLNNNVTTLQNHKNLTFLLRTPKIILGHLNRDLIKKNYQEIFKISDSESQKLALICNGYPFAYQLSGFLYWKYRKIESNFFEEFDSYLSKFVYNKIWEEIPLEEKNFLKLFNSKKIKWRNVFGKDKKKEKIFSVYRKRLIEKGLIVSENRGEMSLTLPRFSEYIHTLEE